MRESLEQRPSAVQLRRLLQVYASALRDTPSDLNLRTKLAEVLRLLGRFEEAIALYSSVAWAYGVSGNLGQAIMICKLILELNPNHSVTQEMLAKLYASKQIREQKQSVPVQQVGGRWVADPRGPGETGPSPTSGTSIGAQPSRELVRPDSARALTASPPPSDSSDDWDFDDDDAARHTGPPEPSGVRDRPAPHSAPPELAEAAARARAIAIREAADAEAPGSDEQARKQRSEHITSHELPAARRPSPTPSALRPASPRSSPSAERRPVVSTPRLEPVPLDRADSMSGLSVDEKQAPAPVFHRVLPTREELPPSALEPTKVDVDLPPNAAPPGFVIRSGPDGRLELDARRESSSEDMRPTTRHDSIRRIQEAPPLPDAEAELSGGPDLAQPEPATPDEEVVQLDAEPPPLPPVESLASALEPLPSSPALVGDEPDTAPATPEAEAIQAAESSAAKGLAVAPPATETPAPERPRINTPPLPLAAAPSRSLPPPARTPSQPATPAVPGPATPRPRRITSPGYLISGPLEPVSSKNVKTTRRYASTERPPVGARPDGVSAAAAAGAPVEATPADVTPAEAAPADVTPAEAAPADVTPAEATPVAVGPAAALAERTEIQERDESPDVVRDEEPSTRVAPRSGDPDTLVESPEGPGSVRPTIQIDHASVQAMLEASDGAEAMGAEAVSPDGAARPTVQMDSAAINSALRRDAEEAFSQRPSAVGYASIQREVLSAGQEQDEAELAAAEADRTEKNLLDTIREAPMELEFEEGVERHVSPFPLFSDLDTAAFLAVVKRMDRRVYAPGTLICSEGDPGDSLYLVASGVLQVLKMVGDQQIQLARLGSGSFFGEFGLLTDGQRHASVKCLEECELLELRRDVLMELSHEHPTISWTLRTFYQQRVMSMVMTTSPLFQAVSPEERKSVLARFAFRRFMQGELIVREGKQGTGFYVILVGTAAVSALAASGAEVKLGVLSEGDYFGEMSLLSGCVAEASVRAESVTEVLMLEPQDFYDLAAEHPEIWAVVQEEAERRRQDTAARLASKVGPTGSVCLI
jgi:CRP-like cAMP-binding protein